MAWFFNGALAIVGQTDPIGYVGPVAVYLFGVTAALGVALGLAVGLLQAERFGLSLSRTFEFAVWGVLAGVTGSRLGYVLTHFGDYRQASGAILRLSEGGFLFYGALLGGVAALLVYAAFTSIDVWRTLDALAPGLALGQAIGLVGAQMLGRATSMPWGIVVQGTVIHPLPAYGIVLTYALFVLLWRLGGEKVRRGSLFLTYLLLHGIGSLLLGSWSSDKATWGLTSTQWLGMAAVITAVAIMFARQQEPLESSNLAGTGAGWGATGTWRSELPRRELPVSTTHQHPRSAGARLTVATLWISGLLVLLGTFAARLR